MQLPACSKYVEGIDSKLLRGVKKNREEPLQNLIIKAAIAPSPLYPEAENAPSSVEASIETASACSGAGASIIHLDGSSVWTLAEWRQVLSGIRRRCSSIVEADFSHRPREDWEALLALRPDVATVPVGHQSYAFSDVEIEFPHSRGNVEELLALCERQHVKPDLEIWHSGSVWRLNDLISKRLVTSPYLLTLYFGWPGANWSPPTVEELLYRFRLLPEGCICCVSVAGRAQNALMGLTLGLGGHLRVGTRDNPFVKGDVLARDNAHLVEQAARLGAASSRKPATPLEARRIIGIPAEA